MKIEERIKLLSITFGEVKFRKLRNMHIPIAERITLISGHNGIGKSTILGLIASGSGREEKSYFDKPFSSTINEIFHLDPTELEANELAPPWPRITYQIPSQKEVWKNIRITKREIRLRSVSTTATKSPNNTFVGDNEKIPLPTIYLGMLRMLPVGESPEKDIYNTTHKMHADDAKYLKDFINRVIAQTAVQDQAQITSQSIKNTGKKSSHPAYSHNPKSISLGQDSLSCIATAIASFNRIKRELGDQYPGGLLIIDEIDAGFHPHALKQLIDAISNAANSLNLQIIATTHSPLLIEYVHPDSTIRKNQYRTVDKIIYLTDTTSPKFVDWSLDRILSDMSLSPLQNEKKKNIPDIKAYLEDNEAVAFLKGVLGMSRNYKKYYGNGNQKRLQIMSIGIGGSNLINLPKHDAYFKKTLLIVDGDTTIPKNASNAIKLPAEKPKNSKA